MPKEQSPYLTGANIVALSTQGTEPKDLPFAGRIDLPYTYNLRPDKNTVGPLYSGIFISRFPLKEKKPAKYK